MKYLTVTTDNGYKYAIPAEIIAKDRANNYKDEEGNSFEEEFEFTMNSDFEISEWFSNNMNWEDVSEHAFLIAIPQLEQPYPGMHETDIENLENIPSLSSGNPIFDNVIFQKKFKFDEEDMTYDKLKFRMDLLKEEYGETMDAFRDEDAEEWVDGHIDLIVIALGNLYLAGVDPSTAWKEVFRANISKERGIKPGREQSGGFDVIKPEGWEKPEHKNNHGILGKIFGNG